MAIEWCFFFFQAEDGIRAKLVTGVQTCALPISARRGDVQVAQVAHAKGEWLARAGLDAPRAAALSDPRVVRRRGPGHQARPARTGRRPPARARGLRLLPPGAREPVRP